MAYEELEALPRGLETPNVYGPADAPLSVQESQLIGSVRKNDIAFKPYTSIKKGLRFGSLAGSHNVNADITEPCPIEYINAINALKGGATVTFYFRLTANTVRSTFNVWLTFGSVLDIAVNNSSAGNLLISFYSVTPAAAIVDTTINGANTSRYFTKDIAIEVNPSLGICKVFNIVDGNRKSYSIIPIFSLANLSNLATANTTNMASIYYAGGETFSVELGGYREDVFRSRARRVPQIPQQPLLPSRVGVPGFPARHNYTSNQPLYPFGIEQDNVFAKGLVAAFNPGATTIIDQASMTPAASEGGVVTLSAENGIIHARPNSSYSIRFDKGLRANGSNADGVFAWFKLETVANCTIVSLSNGTYGPQIRVIGGQLVATATTNSSLDLIWPGTLQANTWYKVMLWSNSAYSHHFYVENDDSYVTSAAGGISPIQSGFFTMNRNPGGQIDATPANVSIRLALGWKAHLGFKLESVRALMKNPWQVLSSAKYPSFVGQNTLPNIQVYREKFAWTSQPQGAVGIDWSNPITRGMIIAYTPTTGNACNGDTGVPNGSIGKVVAGRSVSLSRPASSADYVQIKSATNYTAFNSASGCTALVTSIGGYKQIAGKADGNGNFLRMPAASVVDYTDSIYLRGQRYSTGPNASQHVTASVNTIAVRDDQSQVGLFLNGRKAGGAYYIGYYNDWDPTIQAITLGKTVDGFADDSNLIAFYLWQRNLSDAELASISANPWQIFKPLPRRLENRTPVKPQPLLPKYNPWVSQPQGAAEIDWSNPITRGLVTCIDQQGRSHISGVSLTNTNSFTPKVTNRGLLLSNNGNAVKTVSAGLVAPQGNNFSIVGLVALNTTGQTNKYFALQKSGVSSQSSIIFGYAANSIEVYSDNYTGTNPRTGSSLVISDTNPHVFAYSYNGTNWKSFLDGVIQLNTTRTFSFSTAPTERYLFGSSTSTDVVNASIGLWLVFSRGLSDAEIKSLSANPWQIFKPIKYPARLK